jgi:hypothetical protein
MKSDHDLYEEIQNDIIAGTAVVIREFEMGHVKQQYIARILYSSVNIMLWQYSYITSQWESKPMSILQLHGQEIKILKDFLFKVN